MEKLLFLVADYANITQEGKLNIMGIFNDIYSQNFPARHSSMHLVAKLRAGLGEFGQARNFTVKLLDEDGHPIIDLSGQLQVPPGGHGRAPEVNLILELKDIVFPNEGTYCFYLFIDKDQKADLSIYVHKLDLPSLPGA